MASEKLRFDLISQVLGHCQRLEHERQLAAGTLAQIAVAGHDRFLRSTTKRKFAPCYASIVQSLQDREALISADPGALPDALIARLAVLEQGVDTTVVTGEDPLVGQLFDRLRRLESALLEQERRQILETSEHRYQVVIQFGESFRLEDLACEDIGDLEDLVAGALGNSTDDLEAAHLVDGNSFGAGTIEIFIHTNAPDDALMRLRRHPRAKDLEREMVAAFREFDSEVYTVIWPEGDTRKFDPNVDA